MNKSFFVFLFLSSILIIKSDDRLKIEFFTESLCPDCIQLLTTTFKTALHTQDIEKIADFHLHPYGNAHETQSGSKYVFTCQHGENECYGNLMENCALYQNYHLGLSFSECLEENIEKYNKDFEKTGEFCSLQLNMNFQNVLECMQSDIGNQIQHETAVKTESLQPAHEYVPWIVVNDVHDTDAENQILNDLVGFICKNYKGSIIIDACKEKKELKELEINFKFLGEINKKWIKE